MTGRQQVETCITEGYTILGHNMQDMLVPKVYCSVVGLTVTMHWCALHAQWCPVYNTVLVPKYLPFYCFGVGGNPLQQKLRVN